MLLAAHSIVGGVVGSKADSAIAAFMLGVVTHFLLDSIPHYDTTDKGKFTIRQIILTFFDLALGILVICYVVKPQDLVFWWGVLGGLVPDISDVTPFWRNSFRKTKFGYNFHMLHERIQKYKLPCLPGLAIQWLIILFVIILFQ